MTTPQAQPPLPPVTNITVIQRNNNGCCSWKALLIILAIWFVGAIVMGVFMFAI